MHLHHNPDLAKYAALPDPDERLELLLLMDAALSALIRESAL